MRDKEIHFQIFKGNILNEINEVKKNDGTPFKVFTPFWRNAERHYLDKGPIVEKKITKCLKKFPILKMKFLKKKFYQKKNGYLNLKNIGNNRRNSH